MSCGHWRTYTVSHWPYWFEDVVCRYCFETVHRIRLPMGAR